MIPKQGIRNDPIDGLLIWILHVFSAYSLFFNIKVAISVEKS